VATARHTALGWHPGVTRHHYDDFGWTGHCCGRHVMPGTNCQWLPTDLRRKYPPAHPAQADDRARSFGPPTIYPPGHPYFSVTADPWYAANPTDLPAARPVTPRKITARTTGIPRTTTL